MGTRGVGRCLGALVVTGMVLSLAGGAVRGQQPTFRSGVEVVLIDVTVVGSTGEPLNGLTAADFRVRVDRKPRQIVSAQFLSHAMRLVPRPAAAVPAAPAPAPSAPAPGRDVLIVVDEDSMDAGSGLVARRAIEQFLDRLAPADRVGVATIPRLRSSIALTTNRGDVRKAVREVLAGNGDMAGGNYWIAISEALAMERYDQETTKKVVDRECRGNYPERVDQQCARAVVAEAHQLAMLTHLRSQRSVDGLSQIANGLRQIEGPKTMLLVSGGMPMPETTSALTQLSSAFARGQVSLYTIFVESISQGKVQRRQSPNPSDDDRVEAEGIENLTSAAGGALVRAVGRIESSLDRVALEMSGSYLVGIEVAPSDRDGQPHFVDVSVERRGVIVRARQQYVIPRPALPKAGVVTPGERARDAKTAAAKAREIEVTPPEVEAVIVKASAYASGYETTFSGLVGEEHYQQKLSKWKARGAVLSREMVERGEWTVESTRDLRSDYLLVKPPHLAAWMPFRDVFEVDGQKVRERDQRLQKLFLEAPNSAWDRANEILNESARYNIGYTRNTNLPTLALMFLQPGNREGFVFRKVSEATVEGVAAWQVDYREQARPTLIRNGGADLPAEGSYWIDPTDGRVLKSSVRLKAEASSADVTVSYRHSDKHEGLWVPAEMRETAVTSDTKLECLAQYSNFRRFQVTTEVQIQK